VAKARRAKADKKRGPGRPPRGDAGRREQIPVRVDPKIKQGLESAAAKKRRSLTLEIESRLAASLGEGHQAHIRALIEAIGLLAKNLERRTSKRWVADAFTAQALSAGVDRLLSHFGRYGKPVVPEGVKAAAAKMPAAETERYCTPKGLGESEAFVLITMIESALPPLPLKPEFGPSLGWGHYELLRDLGSGWQRNRAVWLGRKGGDAL
jgi:hypothetical protein